MRFGVEKGFAHVEDRPLNLIDENLAAFAMNEAQIVAELRGLPQ